MRWISPQKRLAINLRDGMECAYCGTDLHGSTPFDVTLDHLVPRNPKVEHGNGGNEATNLVTACRACNSSRQDKPWKEFATGGAIKRIESLVQKDLKPFLTLSKAYFADKVGLGDGE